MRVLIVPYGIEILITNGINFSILGFNRTLWN